MNGLSVCAILSMSDDFFTMAVSDTCTLHRCYLAVGELLSVDLLSFLSSILIFKVFFKQSPGWQNALESLQNGSLNHSIDSSLFD